MNLIDYQIKIIKTIQSPNANHKDWFGTIMPVFQSINIVDREQIFNELLDILLAIDLNPSKRLKSVFNASFYSNHYRNQYSPIDRAISELCGFIQTTKITQHDLIVKRKIKAPDNVLCN